MRIITALSAQKKNTDRINLFVDEKFFCGLTIDDLVKNGIVVGMTVDDEFLSNLLSSSGENDMYNKTLVYILRSPRTETEIRRFLSRKKCSPEMATRIIERLKTMNYINDEAYAKMFTASKHIRVSVRAIKQKLRQRGISTEQIESATQGIDNQDALARSVAEKYMRNKDNDEKNLQKLFRYLVVKGFEYSAVTSIIEDYKSRREIDPDIIAERDNSKNEYIRAREILRASKQKYKSAKKTLREEMENASRN